MKVTLVRFLTLVLAALLAGTSFGIWMGFNPMHLSPATYVEQQQNTIRALNTLMVSLVATATALSIAAAFLQRDRKSVFIPMLAASGLFIACMIISRFGNQPINEQIMTWSVASLPPDWMALRDRWWSFHILRTLTELAALCLIAWTQARPNGEGTPK